MIPLAVVAFGCAGVSFVQGDLGSAIVLASVVLAVGLIAAALLLFVMSRFLLTRDMEAAVGLLFAAAAFAVACERAGVPMQRFVNRTDLACGSTIASQSVLEVSVVHRRHQADALPTAVGGEKRCFSTPGCWPRSA